MREKFWRDPPPRPTEQRVTNLALLGRATPEDFERADTRALFVAIRDAIAAGARTKEDVLAVLPPELREHAEWIGEAGADQPDPPAGDAERAGAEAVTALRLLNARREVDNITAVLADDPSNPALHGRMNDLLAFCVKATAVYPKSAGMSQAALGLEKAPLPRRLPIDALRERRGSL